MVDQLQRRFLLPGDPGWHSKLHVDEPVEQRRPEPRSASVTVRCPNPNCAQDLTFPAGWSGKDGACPSCGSDVGPNEPVPLAPETVVDQPIALPIPHIPAKPVAEAIPFAAQVTESETIPVVRVGCIGRGNAGKTALLRALSEGPVGDFLPSGLHVDADDPREVARMIREAEETRRLLREAGLPPTLVGSQIRYSLYEGAEARAIFQLQEVIGQILTNTLPDSGSSQQAKYEEYLTKLVHSEVLWVVVPCPPSQPGQRERRRYANDLRITMAYLREAIRLRPTGQQVAVVLVLSKIDTLFGTEHEARTGLTDEMLQAGLGPLVDLIRGSDGVCEAAVIPVSAFGFGKAVIKDGSGLRQGLPAGEQDEPFGSEPVWILRDGVEPEPFNLDALFLWTLLFGMRGYEQTGIVEQEQRIRRLSDLLQYDLEMAAPWILPLK